MPAPSPCAKIYKKSHLSSVNYYAFNVNLLIFVRLYIFTDIKS